MKIVINEKYNNLKGFIETLPARIKRGEGDVIHAGRNQIIGFTVEGVEIAVKRYKPVNFFQQIAYSYFCKTKAEKSFIYAKYFNEHGINSPEEVAYIEANQGLMFRYGYFISLKSDYKPAFSELVDKEDYDKQLATGVAKVLVKMHANGILHGDLNLGNFLYKITDSGEYLFSVIDTNRSKILDREPSEKQCIRNMSTLTFRRDLYAYIAGEYAREKGLDINATKSKALKELTRLEKRKQLKYKWKRRLKIS
jgi:tRNA A-37 threonylcarbamoyl transferase component Bud32